jgi:hypothetical protein
MKKLALVVAFALSVLPAFAAEDFTGKWSGSFSGTDPNGSPANENLFLNLIHKGSELTGTAGPTAERQWKILNGKVNDNSVAFEVQGGGGDTQGGPVLKFALTFADGHLKGDVNAERGGEKMTAKVDLTRVK